jgi:hypothetical protein
MLFSPADPGRQARSWDEHAAILRAIVEGDERAAATLAAEHVMRAGMDFLVGLNMDDEAPLLLVKDEPKPRVAAPQGASAHQRAGRKRNAVDKPRLGKRKPS